MRSKAKPLLVTEKVGRAVVKNRYNISTITKIVFAVALVAATLFSGNARKLLSIASSAIESEVFACKEGWGATCD